MWLGMKMVDTASYLLCYLNLWFRLGVSSSSAIPKLRERERERERELDVVYMRMVFWKCMESLMCCGMGMDLWEKLFTASAGGIGNDLILF